MTQDDRRRAQDLVPAMREVILQSGEMASDSRTVLAQLRALRGELAALNRRH